MKTGADYITFDGLPPGQASMGIAVEALRKVCALKTELDTEVWGGYFTKTGLFHCHTIPVAKKFRKTGLKTTLDYYEDYEFLQQIFKNLYVPGIVFGLKDIIALVDRVPQLMDMNTAGLQKCKEHIRETAASVRIQSTIS